MKTTNKKHNHIRPLYPGEEEHSQLVLCNKIQYDYRDDDGELFTGVFNSLEQARGVRDAWRKKKTQKTQMKEVKAA